MFFVTLMVAFKERGMAARLEPPLPAPAERSLSVIPSDIRFQFAQ